MAGGRHEAKLLGFSRVLYFNLWEVASAAFCGITHLHCPLVRQQKVSHIPRKVLTKEGI